MVTSPPMPIIDKYIEHLVSSIPSTMVYDLTDVIFITVVMMLMDMCLRIMGEAINCNKALKRPGTICNLVKVLVWTGWHKVNGKQYLFSKRLRDATFGKLIKSHLLLFALVPMAYILPDTTMFGIQIDDFLAHVCMLLPVFYELTSLIENTQVIDTKGIEGITKAVQIINKVFRG